MLSLIGEIPYRIGIDRRRFITRRDIEFAEGVPLSAYTVCGEVLIDMNRFFRVVMSAGLSM